MSLGDYLLPWKAIPNMIEDVKEASDTSGKNKHKSVFGAIGKYADPAGALFGDRWMEFWHERVPEKANELLQPVGEFHRKYLDPIAMALPEDHKGQKVADFAENKGADTLAAVLGAIFGGGALLGGAAGGGAGGGAGAGAGAGGGSGGWGGLSFTNMNWSDPNTYMQLAGNMPSMGGQQAPQQSPAPVAGRPMSEFTSSAGPSTRLHTVLAQLARTRRPY